MLSALLLTLLADFPRFDPQQIDPHAGEVVYAVTVADVDGDKKTDVVALTEDSVLWYQNPTWEKHVILRGKTDRDNVCIQPHDIDGDGKIDFAIGAGWKPSDTNKASTLQWIGRDAKGEWQLHPITYNSPTLHRIRWGDVLNNGKKQLVAVPLQGRGTKGPNWGEGAGTKIQVFSIPEDPSKPDWPSEVADDTLHTTHNLQLLDLNGDHRDDVLIAGWEGVFVLSHSAEGKWSRAKIGEGNQASTPFKGASEVKLGRLRGKPPFIATIEPWHGYQVVAYFMIPPQGLPSGQGPKVSWTRVVLAEPVAWGHAVWCADLDGDGDDEIVIGQRDPNKTALPRGPGLFVFDPVPEVGAADADGRRDIPGDQPKFTRHTIDDGGMACEDALAADLDGDGKPEIIAGGRATHNVKIYWNKGVSNSK